MKNQMRQILRSIRPQEVHIYLTTDSLRFKIKGKQSASIIPHRADLITHRVSTPCQSQGNSHALTHGRHSALAVAERRELMALVRNMKVFVENVDAEQ